MANLSMRQEARFRTPGGLAALALVVALAGCGGGETSSSGSGQAGKAPAAPAYAIGQAVPAENAELTVTSVKARPSVGADFMKEEAAEGGVLVVVDYKIKNTTSKPMKFYDRPKVALVDGAGQKYGTDAGKSGAYASQHKFDTKMLSDLNPGITVRGADVFEVSKEAYDPKTWQVLVDGKGVALAAIP